MCLYLPETYTARRAAISSFSNERNEACSQSPTVSPESGLDGVDDSRGKKMIVSVFSSLRAFDPR